MTVVPSAEVPSRRANTRCGLRAFLSLGRRVRCGVQVRRVPRVQFFFFLGDPVKPRAAMKSTSFGKKGRIKGFEWNT